MKKSRILANLVAALCVGQAAAAHAENVYHIVVPVKGKTLSNVAVSLNGLQLPQGTVGLPYAGVDFKTLLTVTGDASFTGYGVKWSIIDGSLPTGLTLSSNGVLSGTPTSAGTSTIRLRASYKTKTGENAYQIVVIGLSVSLAAGTAPQALVGQVYSYDLKPLLTVSGDNAYDGSGVTWTVVSSTLPAGLQLKANGTIAGTPSAAGSGTVTARATYRGVNGEQTYQVVTLGINVALAAGTAPQAVVGQVYSYDLKPLLTVSGDNAYDGSGVTWTVVSSTLPAGLQLKANGTIAGTPSAAGSGTVTARATYRGVNGEQTYQVVTLGINVALAAGSPPQAQVGAPYVYALLPLLTVSGDAAYAGAGVTWTVVSSTLPDGLYLADNGSIVGTPTMAGTGTVTARATYRGVNGEQTYQVTVIVSAVLAMPNTASADVGSQPINTGAGMFRVTRQLRNDGVGAAKNVVITVPDGFSAIGSTCSGSLAAGASCAVKLQFLPTQAQVYSGPVTITSDNGGSVSFNVSGVGLDIKVTLADAVMPQAQVDSPYNVDLRNLVSVSGDDSYDWSQVSWSVVSGALPAGLTVGSSGGVPGFIVGTPTASDTSQFTLRATYRGVSAEHAYQLMVTSVEDGVPSASGTGYGDGNGDGIADSRQANVTSLPTVVSGQPYVTLAVDGAYKLTGVTSKLAAGLPRAVKMPLGKLGFSIGNVAPGGTVEVSYYAPSTFGINNYWLYDATLGWTSVSTSVTTVGTKTKVTFNVTDGGPYDADGIANGVITVATQ